MPGVFSSLKSLIWYLWLWGASSAWLCKSQYLACCSGETGDEAWAEEVTALALLPAAACALLQSVRLIKACKIPGPEY